MVDSTMIDELAILVDSARETCRQNIDQPQNAGEKTLRSMYIRNSFLP